jgi:hypothetical protein
MLIDEVEALWAPIAAADDWSAAIRQACGDLRPLVSPMRWETDIRVRHICRMLSFSDVGLLSAGTNVKLQPYLG